MTVDASVVTMKIFILFLTMFAGVYARLKKIIDEKSTKVLSSFLVNITNPLLMLYSFQLDFDIEKLKIGGMIFLMSAIIHTILALLSKLCFFKIKNVKQRSVYEFALIFANCGFIGFPVLMAMFGPIGLFYGAFFTGYFNLFVWTYGVFIMNKSDKASKKYSLKKIFLNSGTVGIIIGMLLFILKIKLPIPVYDACKLVGDMTFPLSMIIIGSLITVMDFKELYKSPFIYLFSFIKLLILPLISIGICYILKLPSILTCICVVMTAMPAATNTAVFSEIYDGDSPLAAKCVGVTTLLSLVTIPIIIYIMNFVFSK